jgi:hypothetical protein
MFTLQNTSPTRGDNQNAIKTLRYLKGFLAQSPCIILLKDLSCVAMSMPPMPIRRTESLQVSRSHRFHIHPYTPKLRTSLLPWTHAPQSATAWLLCKLLRFRNVLAATLPSAKPTPIYMDNQPAIDIALATNPQIAYIEARHHCWEQIQNKLCASINVTLTN